MGIGVTPLAILYMKSNLPVKCKYLIGLKEIILANLLIKAF